MANSFSPWPNKLLLPPFSNPTKTKTKPINPFLRRTNYKPFRRSTLTIPRFGLVNFSLLDIDTSQLLTGAGDLLTRPEALVYKIANSSSAESFLYSKPSSNDWFSGLPVFTHSILQVLKEGLASVHIPYPYGFAIILYAVLVNAATFPTKKKFAKEIRTTMQSVIPQEAAIRERYGWDESKSQPEVNQLYQKYAPSPWPGILRFVFWIAVSIGLYRTLSDITDGGLLTEGFFWIPSLVGPTTIAARQSGSGIFWLFPFVDGQPPLGWLDSLAYLALPPLVGISTYFDYILLEEQSKKCQCEKCLKPLEPFIQVELFYWPIVLGFVSLFVPSGLSLYWITDNILDDAQNWLLKRAAQNPLKDSRFNDISLIKPIQDKPTSFTPRIRVRSTQEMKQEETRRKETEEKETEI